MAAKDSREDVRLTDSRKIRTQEHKRERELIADSKPLLTEETDFSPIDQLSPSPDPY